MCSSSYVDVKRMEEARHTAHLKPVEPGTEEEDSSESDESSEE